MIITVWAQIRRVCMFIKALNKDSSKINLAGILATLLIKYKICYLLYQYLLVVEIWNWVIKSYATFLSFNNIPKYNHFARTTLYNKVLFINVIKKMSCHSKKFLGWQIFQQKNIIQKKRKIYFFFIISLWPIRTTQTKKRSPTNIYAK